MIEINDTFSAKKYNRGWELHRKYPAGVFPGRETKKEFNIDLTFYATFDLLLDAVIDKSVGEVDEIKGIKPALVKLREEMLKAIKEVTK